MLKKTIKYVDFNGVERTEDFYFNLTKAEIAEMEMSRNGGLAKAIENIVQAQDVPRIIEIFKTLIQKSYGVKSPDGRRFIKNTEVLNDFIETDAYSILFMELSTNVDSASAFINNIIPNTDTNK